jgi:hypothetical protein
VTFRRMELMKVLYFNHALVIDVSGESRYTPDGGFDCADT